jgi:rfaE bifunctional protein nucleotidyltransferase chain/domain
VGRGRAARYATQTVPGPVLGEAQLSFALGRARATGSRIVLTNGVFDLLHVGHLRYLRFARAQGELLVVGINADRAVRKPGRPLVPDTERAELVAALDPVDFVIIFGEPTAAALLALVRPTVYVKGADYTVDTLPEAATARELGARLVFAPLLPGHSTSALARATRAKP